MASAWGNSWGSAWGVSWGSPSATVVVDTHDGGKQRDENYDRQRQARERLREQIRLAVEGPAATELAADLESFAQPQVADSPYVPLEERIDVEALTAEIRARIESAAKQAALEDDEEGALLLL